MEVQTKLAIDCSIVVDVDAVQNASLTQQREVQLVILAAKNMSGHFDIAVCRNINGFGGRFLRDGNTKRPATEDVPLRYFRSGF